MRGERNPDLAGTIDELRLLVESAAARRPQLTGRLEKAAFLVLLRPIQKVDGDVWQIPSEDGLRFYRVTRGECNCSDYLRHGAGHPCKHRLALFLHRALEVEGARDSKPTRQRAQQAQGRRRMPPELHH
jgi:SWIM zinc finger